MGARSGNEPLDNEPAPARVPEDQRIPPGADDGPEQIRAARASVRVSKAGSSMSRTVGGKRVQVFTLEANT